MRLKNSFWALLGRSSDTDSLQIEHIRIAMLNALEEHCDESQMHLGRSIRYATDLESLWYLRPNLLNAIASCSDQTTATVIVRDITQLFKGHLPLAKSSQFGKL